MSRRGRFVLGTTLVAGALLVFLLPFSLMLLPNPAPQRVAGLGPSAETGVYLRVGADTMRVFPYGSPLTAFPKGAASVPASSLVLVKYRNLGPLSGYAIHAFPSGTEVPVERVDRPSQQLLEIHAANLAAGRYYVTKTREGMWGGTDYVYFRVE